MTDRLSPDERLARSWNRRFCLETLLDPVEGEGAHASRQLRLRHAWLNDQDLYEYVTRQ